ncbi:MAG: MarR family winged helix-turn-helix transcriptional regulator [Phenylobacterium sp.]|uniref:MarR family winged helix-turn-helix transcriptional regulator n=1 Tax=Phenylobacterium sp. TaxID=1871053 RepID=UPI00391AF833
MAKDKTSDKGKSAADDGVPALDRSPSHLLHRALQLALDVYAEEVGPTGLTQRQYAVLAAVEAREGLTQTDLVRITGIDRSTLADMAQRMIAKGLLVRERSAEDARANAVHLSEQGRLVLAEASPRVAAADARLLRLLSSGKRDGFLSLLRELARADLQAPPAAAGDKKKKKKVKAEKAEKAAVDGKKKKTKKAA